MKRKQIGKTAVFLLLLLAAVIGVSNLLAGKWRYPCFESVWQKDFYELEDNSVEVCVIGSSQIVHGVANMELYGDYGISAYSFGSSVQPMIASYAWLRECMETQDIRVVMLDVSCLYQQSALSLYRKAFDGMKLSKNKLEILWELCETNEEADPFMSYVLPIFKYHSRWDELKEADFALDDTEYPVFRGHYVESRSSVQEFDKIAYDSDTYNEKVQMVDHEKEYFDRIVEYCAEEGLELLLFKTPKMDWSLTNHMQVQAYADELGLEFLDFSSAAMINELGLNVEEDFFDDEHLNIKGAQKMTAWLGEYLSEHYELTDFRTVEGYDDLNYDRYVEYTEDSMLNLCEDPESYFSMMNSDRYEVLVQLSSSSDAFYSEEMTELLQCIGVTVDMQNVMKQRFAAWTKDGELLFQTADKQNLEYIGQMADGVEFRIRSSFSKSQPVQIRIGREELSFKKRGLNILVYDSQNQRVVEKSTLCFNNGSGLQLYKEN